MPIMIKEAQMYELNTIKEQISKGESLYIEFKEFFSKANDIAAEIVAFANSEGGDIFFGIADNG
ncbi:MAG: ATP-binding protein, partial [Candidatus Cloacimonetes bacterium]|nr:ATP-binding protein [Candidatus Cloacimonadota bacterium]